MTTKNKIIIIVTTIVVLVIGVVAGRLALNSYIQKQINVVRPTDITSFTVKTSNFFETIDAFGTALANQSFAIRIKKADLISSVEFDKNLIVQKNQLIAQLKNDKIIAPFTGRLGVREITPGIFGGDESIIATLDDIDVIKVDVKIAENYSTVLKKNLRVEATSDDLKKTYSGTLETISSRVDPITRSILTQVRIKNTDLKIVPGMLINISVIYNEKEALEVPEESIVQQGNRTIVYKIIDDKSVALTEVKVGLRNFGKAEIISGLNAGDKIVKEGISKVRDKSLIKVIN
jgi:membrane fusion protein (multidrug efflux system)